ncbi:MAG TPA: mercury(II) reductase [Desulfuromonadaceae bacterium]
MSANPDLIILGSGSTAFAAALRANTYGKQVLMVEKSVLGGTCINWGCIPSKTMIHAAHFIHNARLGSTIGLRLEYHGVDFEKLCSHRDQVVLKLRKERYLDVLQNVDGLELVKGTARFIDSKTIEANAQRYQAEHILVAVGGLPRIPNIAGLNQCDFLTSRSALLMKRLPSSMVIIGGGVIAVELGQMFHRLGCHVTILEHGPSLLPAVDTELSQSLLDVLLDEGITFVPSVAFCSVKMVGEQTVVSAEISGKVENFSCEKLLVAVGTSPAIGGIGLDKAGIEKDPRGFIITDRQMRTSKPGIWAAGDVTGGMMIATVGAREGIVAVDDMFNRGCGCAMDYMTSPMTIFTDPEVGIVGHTEESARQAGYDPIVSRLQVSAIPKAHVTGHTAGIIKMVADNVTRRLLGVHLVSYRGAEMINEAGLALHQRITVDELASTLHIYPSIGEGLKLCAQSFSRDVSRLSCCAE